ncbi:alpha-L-fucosidase, partial [Actinomyces trachealis]|uniref:alpha-L-fucosidase n=1 Tax=Actinomyces trachealis TaxID=2763540 RepID=UPI001892AAC4
MGLGQRGPQCLQPQRLDTDQWAKTLSEAGFRYAILTVKHHDGFTLFPSRYTSHDVEATSWENGKGDVVRRFVDSAHKHNLKVGFYLSPADSYQERQGVYGNGKPKVERTIPTLVDGDTRTGKIGSPEYPGSYQYKATDYGALFLNTIYELMTQYGPVDEMWFDGANGNTSHTENYDFQAYFNLIHTLQPNTLIAVAGPDVRWVGNEGGLARSAEWSPQAVKAYDNGRLISVPSETASDLGSSASIVQQVKAGAATEIHWYPAEADVSIHDGWFWHDEQQPKSVSQLMDIYKRSYGRNSVLLLNIPPNKAGQIDQRDVTRLREWTAARSAAFSDDAALGRPASISLGGQTITDATLTDGSTRTSAPNASGTTSGTWTVELADSTRLSSVLVAEDTLGHGQQVESFTVELRNGGTWRTVASQPNIGAHRIVTFPEQDADAVRVTVNSARGPVHLSELRAFRAGAAAMPTTLYVDTSAATSGPGTQDSPIANLEQLRSMTLPTGTTVLFKRGSTLTGALQLWGYGTAEQPIKVGLYGEGAEPVVQLDGVKATTLGAALEELGLKAAGWAMDEAPQPEPTPTPTPAPTSTPEPVPTGTGVPVPEPVVMPAYVAKVQASSSGLVLKG